MARRKTVNDDKLIKEFSKKNYKLAKLCRKFTFTKDNNERKELAEKIKKLENEVKILQKEMQKKRYRSITTVHFVPKHK